MYFFMEPFALSTGYFSPLALSLAQDAAIRSISSFSDRLSIVEIRLLLGGKSLGLCVMAKREFIVYVVELTDEIKNKGGFIQANPNGSKCCLYVGYSGKTAEERFIDHAEGRPSGSSYIRGYVKALRPELAPKSRLLSRENAMMRERKHAEKLRRHGYFVWQKD